MTSLDTVVISLLCMLLALAALIDIWKLQIPNLFPVAIILLLPAWVYHTGWNNSLWQNGAVFLVAFFGGALLFSRGLLGGGDVKLLAAAALWFDFRGAAALFLYVAIGGILLSIAFILLRRLLPERLTGGNIPSLKARGPIPYGVAIAGGAVLAILGSNINPQPVPWYRQPLKLTTDYKVSAASIMINWARD
jgi:prepilin peptidase CpaA